MPRLAALLIALIATAPAAAADLPARSRIGEIFAEPAPRGRAAVAVPPPAATSSLPVFAPEVDIQPLVNGNYGKPNSYSYTNYYGTSRMAIFSRLPYACGWYGYC